MALSISREVIMSIVRDKSLVFGLAGSFAGMKMLTNGPEIKHDFNTFVKPVLKAKPDKAAPKAAKGKKKTTAVDALFVKR
jgi:hypothetical protein